MDTLQIISWNCRSIYNKLFELKKYIYIRKPEIVCLQETWIKAEYLPAFINYSVFFKNRPGRAGGLAIITRNDLVSEELELQAFQNGKLEIQRVKIKLQNGRRNFIEIVNLYNPNESITEGEYRHYLSQLGDQCIFIGDFNAHHPLWDARARQRQICPSGRNLVNALTHFPLQLVTTQSLPTYIDNRTGNSSTIDLCFISPHLFGLTTSWLGEDCGSDHCPIHIEIQINLSKNIFKVRRKWKFNELLWENFTTELPDLPNRNQTIEEMNLWLVTTIFNTADQVFGRTPGNVKCQYNNAWWTPACEQTTRARKRAKALLLRRPTPENAQRMRETQAIAKQTLKEAKENKKRTYINQIKSDSPVGQVWEKINKLNCTYKPNNSPLLVNNNLITNSKDKVKVFADYFAEIFHSNENIDPASLQQHKAQLDLGCGDETDSYNCHLTKKEMTNVIRTLKSNSPGEDYIHNDMIKVLPDKYLEYILQMFNKIWDEGTIPAAWKASLIIPIHKMGKSQRLAQSYRPISLLSCIGKLYEKIIINRTYWHLENNNSFSKSQSGFRSRLNTSDQIARLEKIIRETYLNKGVCTAVFVDLKGAYDKVNHRILLKKLLTRGIKGKLLKYFRDFLKDRTFKVLFNGEVSASETANIGVPQGAPSSPVLFNVHISDIPETNGVIRTEYADDIAFVATGNTIEESTHAVQEALNVFYQYTEDNLLELNYQKTVAMIFTRKRIYPPPIHINHQNINYVSEFKFLGLTFDGPYLNWQKHIARIRGECLGRINILKAISHKEWGADKVMLLRVYKALILTKINYGREFYSTASNNALKTLEPIQNIALRISVMARETSPILSLEVECNIPPLKLQTYKIILDYYNRFRNLPNHLQQVSELMNRLQDQLQLPWTDTTPPPLLVRIHRTLINQHFNSIDYKPLPLTNIRPPWDEYLDIDEFLFDEPVNILSDGAVQNLFKARSREFGDAVRIFTDGSKCEGLEGNTAAALAIPELDITIQCRLPNAACILTAELFAIDMALDWFSEHIEHQGCVIYTDSLSSVRMIGNPKSKQDALKHSILAHIEISKQQSRTTSICWIPSHRGIDGNERADVAAKEATNNNIITLPHMPKKDIRKIIRKELFKRWKESWDNQAAHTNTGHHMRLIRSELGLWPWTSYPQNRKKETALARLRIGHSGLRMNAYRFGRTLDPLCECGQPETISHYLINCQEHIAPRQLLQQKLNIEQIPFTIKNLLGGGKFPLSTQYLIARELWNFIIATNKANSI